MHPGDGQDLFIASCDKAADYIPSGVSGLTCAHNYSLYCAKFHNDSVDPLAVLLELSCSSSLISTPTKGCR